MWLIEWENLVTCHVSIGTTVVFGLSGVFKIFVDLSLVHFYFKTLGFVRYILITWTENVRVPRQRRRPAMFWYFRLPFWRNKLHKTSSDGGNTESEVCVCNKENINNNRSSEAIPTATTGFVPMVDKDIEDFTNEQQALNTKKGTETAVRRLKSWYL